jgi:3',5'-cyclic AMP phosphodiesterase CpdA
MRRRHWLWCGAATTFLIVGIALIVNIAYPWARWTEDFFPGSPPDAVLEPHAWSETATSLTFAVVGDTGTGGRNQMAVARQMADTYTRTPFGLVVHVGDISYYGSVADRWEQVFVEPYGPLLDAGVTFEMAVGNHELEEESSTAADAEIAAEIERIGSEGRYYSVRHGPVDFFVIDSSTPLITGNAAADQVAWLDAALGSSDAPWKIAVVHHPPYASGPKRGSNLEVRAALEPLFIAHGVDLVLTGHDHFYERSHPQDGIVYVVSGAGAKLSAIGHSDFTATSLRELEFMLIEVAGHGLRAQAIGTNGEVLDRFEIEQDGS